jgi:hypothetical protein
MPKLVVRAVALATFAVVLSGVTSSPVHAKCVAADVYVHVTNQPDRRVLTEGQCLLPTPFTTYVRDSKDVHIPTVTGVPSGAYVEVIVPLP